MVGIFTKMKLAILNAALLPAYRKHIKQSPAEILNELEKVETPVDYFKFYNAVSSVYSSKIEGEDIDFDSFFKYKFMRIRYQPDYTKKADDLYAAYQFIFKNKLTLKKLQKVHGVLSASLLPKSQQGFIRINPMFVINNNDRIEYVATEPSKVKAELKKLFTDIKTLQAASLNAYEIFYYAAYIHLVFVKIHPFQDGNGRTARLLEKWFLIKKMGDKATAVQLEKNYYKNLTNYYSNIKQIGSEYEQLNYAACLPFLLMTVTGMREQ